jgi:hypothetical protein
MWTVATPTSICFITTFIFPRKGAMLQNFQKTWSYKGKPSHLQHQEELLRAVSWMAASMCLNIS